MASPWDSISYITLHYITLQYITLHLLPVVRKFTVDPRICQSWLVSQGYHYLSGKIISVIYLHTCIQFMRIISETPYTNQIQFQQEYSNSYIVGAGTTSVSNPSCSEKRCTLNCLQQSCLVVPWAADIAGRPAAIMLSRPPAAKIAAKPRAGR